MFPNIPGAITGGPYQDAARATRREPKPASRLDVQRRHLEHKKVYHLDSMSVDQRALDRDRDLARRQMIAQTREPRVSKTSKFRHSFGGALISIGERIRPQFVSKEPTFNG